MYIPVEPVQVQITPLPTSGFNSRNEPQIDRPDRSPNLAAAVWPAWSGAVVPDSGKANPHRL